jgi:hypothetical protein
MVANKKGKKASDERPVVRRGSDVLIPMMCYCTWKTYPHFHKRDFPVDAPWNWDSTHAFWNKENEGRKPKFKATDTKNS